MGIAHGNLDARRRRLLHAGILVHQVQNCIASHDAL
jgi:hypothetical protein